MPSDSTDSKQWLIGPSRFMLHYLCLMCLLALFSSYIAGIYLLLKIVIDIFLIINLLKNIINHAFRQSPSSIILIQKNACDGRIWTIADSTTVFRVELLSVSFYQYALALKFRTVHSGDSRKRLKWMSRFIKRDVRWVWVAFDAMSSDQYRRLHVSARWNV